MDASPSLPSRWQEHYGSCGDAPKSPAPKSPLQPLLFPSPTNSVSFDDPSPSLAFTHNQSTVYRVGSHIIRVKAEASDSMTYQASSLNSWRFTFSVAGTVFGNATLWVTMIKLTAVAAFIAALSYFIVSNPLGVHLGKFRKISKFLNFFVGLVLGFFVKSAVARWFSCVDGFLELTDAVRNLQMQLCTLGVPQEHIDTAIRYGFTSAWLLNVDLHVMTLDEDQKQKFIDAAWCLLDSSNDERAQHIRFNENGHLIRHEKLSNLSPVEIERLRKCEEPAGMIWFWVASFIGRMAQDKLIPPMASPTYGRIMNLCQNAHLGIREVRASMAVQAPFSYVHICATLVHINNIVNAIGYGLTLGPSLGVLLLLCGYRYHDTNESDKIFDRVAATVLILDFQDCIVNFCYNMIGPLFYTAILEMCILIEEPFTSKIAQIPTPRLLEGLADDLEDGFMMADADFLQKPCYGDCV